MGYAGGAYRVPALRSNIDVAVGVLRNNSIDYALPQVYSPTATLLEHTLLTQGFMSTSKAVSLIAGDRNIVILRGQFWATPSSVAVGIVAGAKLSISKLVPWGQ